MRSIKRLTMVLCVLSSATWGWCDTGAVPGFEWSILVGVDPATSDCPTDNRGLALDETGTVLYRGFNGGTRQVQRIDLPKVGPTVADALLPSALATGDRGKAIAVGSGRVFTTGYDGESIRVYDAELVGPATYTADMFGVSSIRIEGLAVSGEDDPVWLYAADRDAGTLSGLALQGQGAAGDVGTLSMAMSWQVAVPGAVQPRGVAVDKVGRVWVADSHADTVSRYEVDTDTWQQVNLGDVGLGSPYYIAFVNDLALVTLGYRQTIAVLDLEQMTFKGTVRPPWDELGLAVPYGRQGMAMLTGITALPDGQGVMVSWEGGVTLDGALADPVLLARVPEPATLALLAAGLLVAVRRRRRS